MDKAIKFMLSCVEVLKGKPADVVFEVTCPICGKLAKCVKASCNGHRRGECECGMNFIE